MEIEGAKVSSLLEATIQSKPKYRRYEERR
jgi:hypothetical protein